MMIQHKELAAGRWAKLSLCEQMANIGSEVDRAIHWKKKGREEFSRKSAIRALELIDLSLEHGKTFCRYKEIARLREAVVDYFFGENQFRSSEDLWRKYFNFFNYTANLKRR